MFYNLQHMEKQFTVRIKAENKGERIDSILCKKLTALTRSAIQRLMREGNITIDSLPVKPSQKLKGGEMISVIIPAPSEISTKAEDIPLEIVYEDSDLLVIDKPAGMVVHPAAGNYSGTLVNALLHHCKDLSGIGGEIRPGIVHRLDKDTSGLIVAAKNDSAHISLSKQLKSRALTRIYKALTRGIPRRMSGIIDASIGRNPLHRKKMAVLKEGGREAVTHYRVEEKFAGYALIELSLKTGRTHQIRVHLKSVNCPLLGDATYGHGITEKEKRMGLRLGRQALHAETIKFIHPAKGEEMEFHSPLPQDMKHAIEVLKTNCKS